MIKYLHYMEHHNIFAHEITYKKGYDKGIDW